MINVSVGTAQILFFTFVSIGIVLVILGWRCRKNPKWHPKSIYDKPPKQLSLWEQLKTPFMTGWNMGMAYGEKKREERQRRG